MDETHKKRKIVVAGIEIEVDEMDPKLLENWRTRSKEEWEVIVYQDWVNRYKLFRRATGAKCDVVYHPCCETDVSASRAFPESKILYVDIEKKAIEALQKAGCDARHVSALEFDPGEVDVLIMMNPMIYPEIPAQYVASGGYVLCNDYHKTARKMKENSDFQFVGIIWEDERKGLIFDTEQLDDCWSGKKGGIDDFFVFKRTSKM